MAGQENSGNLVDTYNTLLEGVPPRIQHDYEGLRMRDCSVVRQEDVDFVGQNLIVQEIMLSKQFTLVHSTKPSSADKAMKEGLVFRSLVSKGAEYAWSFTRLYSPMGPDGLNASREWWNTFALSYRYADSAASLSNSAKMILQFPFLGTQIPDESQDLAHSTPLERAPKRFVEKIGIEDHLRIRPEFIRGYLDFEAGTFVGNPLFNINARRRIIDKLVRPLIGD